VVGDLIADLLETHSALLRSKDGRRLFDHLASVRG
jgi:hypothetical protein